MGKLHRLGLIAYAGLVLAAGPADATPKPVIPKAFQGTWYEADRACDDNNQYPVEVEATGISSGEDSSNLVSIRILSKTHIRIVTDDYGEMNSDDPSNDAHIGKSRTDLTLSDSGKALKIVYRNGMVSRLKRCPTG